MDNSALAITEPAATYEDAASTDALAPGVMTLWRSTPGGAVTLAPAPVHRIRIHTSEPVSGYCSEKRFLYTRGDIDIMPSGYGDSWREDAANTSLFVAVAPTLLQRTADELEIAPTRRSIELRHQVRDPQIEHIAWALDSERRSDYANGALYTESLATALAVHLLRRYTTAAPSVPARLVPKRLQRLREYIDAHLDQSLGLIELARVAGLSPSHLKTQFRKETGMAVHQYVIARRVQRAHQLLSRTALPISQVALEVGFSHQSHLARWTGRILGTTPGELRRR